MPASCLERAACVVTVSKPSASVVNIVSEPSKFTNICVVIWVDEALVLELDAEVAPSLEDEAVLSTLE